ncbi:hypothetical protein JCM10213v2_004820 [Rhodosporidiobolus nylandii]
MPHSGPRSPAAIRAAGVPHAVTFVSRFLHYFKAAFLASYSCIARRLPECLNAWFLNLTEFKSFAAWESDPVIAEAARRLYNIDNLELMPGLACEEAKPSMEGSGLCPGYAISRAILSDAASLLTSDCTAGNLTSYQWKDLQPDLHNGAFRGYISKLLLRYIPQSYTLNSTYTLYPFIAPHTTGGSSRFLTFSAYVSIANRKAVGVQTSCAIHGGGTRE